MATFTRAGTRKRPSVTNPKIIALLEGAGWEATGSSQGEAPRGNASRDEWAAYAVSLGIDVADDDKRDDIKAAIESHAG